MNQTKKSEEGRKTKVDDQESNKEQRLKNHTKSEKIGQRVKIAYPNFSPNKNYL